MSAPQTTTIHRTYQLRGYTSRTGYGRIREVLGVCQRLYNRMLAERIAVYRMAGKTMGKYAMMKRLTHLRRETQELSEIDLKIERGALVRLDRAFQAFFRRVKAGDGYGFPRFKPRQRYTCLELAQVTPAMLKGNRIKIKGLPSIRIRPSRPLPKRKPVSMRLIMRGRIFTIDLVYAEQVEQLPYSDKAVGIDLGVNERMTLSTGETVERRQPNRKRQRVLQRAISRKRKSSNSRHKAVAKLARFKRREQIVNRNECHRITTDLIRKNGLIAIEGLRVKDMTRDNRGLNREILGQTWGVLRQQLAYKAEWGRSSIGRSQPCLHVSYLL